MLTQQQNPKQSYHTPLALWLGIPLNWKLTVGMAMTLHIWVIFASLMAGVNPVKIILDLWMWVWPFLWYGISIIVKRMFNTIEDIFDVFDPEIEKNLKLWQTMDQSETEKQKRFRSLFINEEEYNRFRRDLQSSLFGDNELKIFLVIFSIQFVFFILALMGFSTDSIVARGLYGLHIQPWVDTVLLADMIFFNFTHYLAGSVVVFLAVIVVHMSRLSDYRKGLKAFILVDALKEDNTKASSNDMMGYDQFFEIIRDIGQFLYETTLHIVILMGIWTSLASLLLTVPGHQTTIAMYSNSVFIVFCALVILIAPQLGIHRVLSELADDSTNVLTTHINQLNNKLIHNTEFFLKQTSNQFSVVDKDLILIIERFESIRSRIEESSHWAFHTSMAVKVLVASLIPLMSILASEIIHRLLETILTTV